MRILKICMLTYGLGKCIQISYIPQLQRTRVENRKSRLHARARARARMQRAAAEDLETRLTGSGPEGTYWVVSFSIFGVMVKMLEAEEDN